MKKKFIFSFVLLCFLLQEIKAQGTMMPIPPQTSTYTGNARGYWFTAPTDFTIAGLRVPIDISGDQTIEIIRFNSGPPPEYTAITNDFVSLGRWVGVAGEEVISCNISVSNGDYIGILGCRGTTSSFGSNNYITSIDGYPLTLQRLGMQYQLPTNQAQDIWTQAASTSLGRIEMYYNTQTTWTGLVNTDWNNADNWSGLYVPNQYTDVVIPSGCPNYPLLSGTLGINIGVFAIDCKSLNINSGASVTAPGYDVNNYGDLTVDGTLEIGDDFTLYSGSTVDFSGTIRTGTQTGLHGSAIHKTGSIFNKTGHYYVESISLNDGCQFNGTAGATHIYTHGTALNNYIEIDDPDSYFYAFRIETGANAELFDCSYDLEVTSSTYVYGFLNINSYTLNSMGMNVYGELIINSGGTVNNTGPGTVIYGGGSSGGGSLTMSSGSTLYCGDELIFLGGSENISGGEIFLNETFTDHNEIFSPTGGSVTFNGGSTSDIWGPTTFYDLIIDKTGGEKSDKLNNDKKVISVDDSKDNIVYLMDHVHVENELTINNGELDLNGRELIVDHNCFVYGTLNIDDPAANLTVGTNNLDRLNFYSGSTGNLADGSVHIYGWIQPFAGCSFTASLNNTVYINGTYGGGPHNSEPTAVYGNMEILKNAGATTFISGNATHSIVINGNLIVHPDNILVLQDETVIVHGNLIDNSTSGIYVYTTDKNGSITSEQDKILAQGQIIQDLSNIKEEPSDVSGAKGGYLEIDSSFTLNGLMDVGNGNVLLHGDIDIATTGVLTINGGSVIADQPHISDAISSKEPANSKNGQYLFGTINMTDGLFEISHNSIQFSSTSVNNISGGIIRCGFTFYVNNTNIFQPTGGTVEFVSFSPGSYIYCDKSDGNYFNNLAFDQIGTKTMHTDIEVKGNITIEGGILLSYFGTDQYNIYVGGNWTNNDGYFGFNGGTGSVIFNGNGPTQNINGITSFYNFQQDYVAPGSYIQISGITYISNEMILNYYTWINNTIDLSGTLDLNNASSKFTVNVNGFAIIDTLDQGGLFVCNGGTIRVNDLVEPGLIGNHLLIDGTVDYYQDATQYLDINGNLTIQGGEMNLFGFIGNSVWGYANDASVTISGGVLDVKQQGIFLDPYNVVNTNITGGIIRTPSSFSCERSDFNPSGGSVELYGGNDAMINVFTGSNFWDLLINKTGGDKSSFQLKDRDGNVIESTKSNMAYLSNNLVVEGELVVDKGTLSLDASTLTCYDNIDINDGGILNVNDNSTLALDVVTLGVNSGGTLNMLCTAENEAQITHISSGLYSLWINEGGTISVEHALFEYMTWILLAPGSVIDPVHCFHNCTFQNGSSGFPLLYFANEQTLQINNAIFPTNTWSGPYNLRKYSSVGDITFYNATGDFAGPEFEHDDYNSIDWITDTYQVDLEVFLEGPFNSSSLNMDYTLNNLDLIPTSQPFDSNSFADWYYTGSESVGSIPDFVTDWILVELRDAPDVASALPGRVIARQAGFVTNTGNVVGLDGLNPMDFNAAIFNNLFVNVWHRNHLGVISANPLINVDDTYSYNFFSGSGQALGGTSAQVELTPGIWGILSGDANGSGHITSHDVDNYWAGQAGETGYKVSDFNLDGQADNIDKNDYWLPNNGSSSLIPE